MKVNVLVVRLENIRGLVVENAYGVLGCRLVVINIKTIDALKSGSNIIFFVA